MFITSGSSEKHIAIPSQVSIAIGLQGLISYQMDFFYYFRQYAC